MKKLKLAFSPCPNDTFIMYAIVHKKIELYDFEFKITFLDIEKLNTAALKNEFHITKASAALLPFVQNTYTLLQSGAAFGKEGGPLLIANAEFEHSPNNVIAIPGIYTSAHALFNRYYTHKCKKEFVLFSEIFALLASGRCHAGVIIHEDRFTFWQHGFECIQDLGLEWKKETELPVPLGVFLAHQSLDSQTIQNIEKIIGKSIEYARNNFDETLPWIQEYARNEHPDVIKKHIDFYVNEYSLNMGADGKRGIETLNKQL
jgi:1,4-dihydroxy-6-naphthoate synthase